jgi:lipooligosaccharide transport system permease protein
MWRELFDWRTRAVTGRNLLVYLRNWRSAFLPPVLEPVVMFLVFGLGLGTYIGSLLYQGREVSYLEYVAPGILTYTLFTTSFMESLYGSFVRMFYQKTFEGITGTGVERVNIIWGEMLWASCRATLYSLCVSMVLAVFHLAGLISLSLGTLLFLIPLGALVTMSFSSFGLLFTARVPTIDHMNYPVFLVGVPLSLISNTYFPVDEVHRGAWALAQLNPLYHLSRIFRHFLLGGGPETWMIFSLLLFGAAGLGLSALAHRWMDRRIEKES